MLSGLARDLRRKADAFPLPLYVAVNNEQDVGCLRLESLRDLLVQPANELSIAFRTSTTPHAFAIDRSGIVVATDTPNTFDHLLALVRPALREGGDALRRTPEEVVPA